MHIQRSSDGRAALSYQQLGKVSCAPVCPFGDEPGFLREPVEVGAHLLRRPLITLYTLIQK